MLKLYRFVTSHSDAVLRSLLDRRLRRGKEIEGRVQEKRGVIDTARPEGRLVWLHAASVGEVQSALILLDHILNRYDALHVLVTTGTRTSAEFCAPRLPARCIHQFYPLDHPDWVARFLDHWRPDLALWMESELWPNMILEMKARGIPAVLLNARMSDSSFRRWRWMIGAIQKMLKGFDLVCAQNAEAASKYKMLGAGNVVSCGNLKYSAAPLPCDEGALSALRLASHGRPLWLYASTHEGEEALACYVHGILKNAFPDLLSVIVPRHPERGIEIQDYCEQQGLDAVRRREVHRLPDADTDIYVADTMGELGLFYRLVPISVIGRCFSTDGGGGHNPIEAAQLGSVVLSGPNVQHFRDVYAQMWEAGAAVRVEKANQLVTLLQDLLSSPEKCENLRRQGLAFAEGQRGVVESVMEALKPQLESLGLSEGGSLEGCR